MRGEGVIDIKSMAIGYRGRKPDGVVVADINASLVRGEVVALIGRNGAGKSTLLRTLAGYNKPLSGEICYCGSKADAITAVELSKMVSVVLTNGGCAPALTVRELVSLGRSPYTNFVGQMRPCDKERVEWAIAAIKIENIAERRLSELSDGERQKAMIAKALAQETPIILLDEPTAYLDFNSRVALFRLLKKMAVEMNKAVLVSTHDLELVFRMADLLWLVDGGKLHCGTFKELTCTGILKNFLDGEGVFYNEEKNILEIV